MSKELDYVAVCPDCKRIVTWMSGDLVEMDPKGMAKDIASLVRAGFGIERRETSEVRGLPIWHADDCPRRAKRKGKKAKDTPLFA